MKKKKESLFPLSRLNQPNSCTIKKGRICREEGEKDGRTMEKQGKTETVVEGLC